MVMMVMAVPMVVPMAVSMIVVMPVIVIVIMPVVMAVAVLVVVPMIMRMVVVMAVPMVMFVLMVMPVPMVVPMVVPMIVPMIVAVPMIFRRAGADAFDMMVMAFLRQADLVFEAQHLIAVFAHLTVHVVRALDNLEQALCKGFHNHRVIIQITSLHKFQFRVPGGDLVGVIIDAFDQNAGEQEIGEHDDPLVSHAGAMLQGGLYQREGHTGIADFHPAKAHAFPQHPRHFGYIGIGIGIRRAAPDDA